ncbi:MAG: 4-(cytidine 5'-diphospho)-2-C-methyl-D-erythritol kinase [Thermodesulfobacteriota bacterium]|nr:4-(cytidine 5'-diphospho)-2-C-methyl-D-erythritol kinase [Thermodesulfobacteriota bacterium]
MYEDLLSESSSRVQAPAKLNIRLKVTGRRPDGYHELVSIMVPVTLFDHLELTVIPQRRITLTCQGLFPVPANTDNLAYRAAAAFFSLTNIRPGLSIRLAKNIPVAAGLGGGSSDASSTLMGLNRMWSNPLTSQQLAELAVGLGADVPFFLKSRPCIATGIGEVLEPISNWPQFRYVIVTPDLHVSTSWVYENVKIGLTDNEYESIIKILGKESPDLTKILENDLEAVTSSHFPVIHTIKKALMDAGAEGVLMSGSGPSVFGIFRSKDTSLAAKRQLSSQNLGHVFEAEDTR